MNKAFVGSGRGLLLILVLGLSSVNSMARDRADRDPARWYKDLTSPQDRYQNAKKESMAAYQQALTECRDRRGREATMCKNEARKNFNADMAEAKRALHDGGSVVTR